MRIHITGNAGSGKTTLARHLGNALDLPVFGLDAVVWQPGWRKTPAVERDAAEEALIARPVWVIEGVSPIVRQAADVVILLEVSRCVALLRCAKRNWRYLFRSRPGLPSRCPEVLIIPRLVRLIWRFPARVQPVIVEDMRAGSARFIRVRKARELVPALASVGIDAAVFAMGQLSDGTPPP